MQKAICRRLIDQLATLNSADINSRNYIKEKIVRVDIECASGQDKVLFGLERVLFGSMISV